MNLNFKQMRPSVFGLMSLRSSQNLVVHSKLDLRVRQPEDPEFPPVHIYTARIGNKSFLCVLESKYYS